MKKKLLDTSYLYNDEMLFDEFERILKIIDSTPSPRQFDLPPRQFDLRNPGHLDLKDNSLKRCSICRVEQDSISKTGICDLCSSLQLINPSNLSNQESAKQGKRRECISCHRFCPVVSGNSKTKICDECKKSKKWCTECNTVIDDDKFKLCERCRKKRSDNRKKTRQAQKPTIGLCSKCGLVKEQKNQSLCIKCREESKLLRIGDCIKCCDGKAIVAGGFCGKCRFTRAKNEARRREIPWNINIDNYLEKIVKPCFYCELPNTVKQGIGLDRIDNNLNYTHENTLSCCEFCNKLRADNCNSTDFKIYFGPQVRRYRIANDPNIKEWCVKNGIS